MSTVLSGATTTASDNGGSGNDGAADRRPPATTAVGKVTGNVRHVSVPQMDTHARRQEMMNRPSSKDLMAYQQRQQYGRSNSAATVPSVSERGHRTSGRRSPAVYGVGGGSGGGGGNSGGGGGFKSKLRNSFRSTAKRIRQQQTAIDALAKNSQMLGLHNLQESPRTAAATMQRTTSRVRQLTVSIMELGAREL